MCKFCERGKTCNEDACNLNFREHLVVNMNSKDVDVSNMHVMANIIAPTPITVMRNKDGLAAKLHIYLTNERSQMVYIDVPMRYCPYCGKDLHDVL